MNKALEADLDAYLDRELFVRPSPEQTATPAEKPAERLNGVLALAAEEEQWLRTRPTSEEPAENSKDLEGKCLIPEHLKAGPGPEVSPPAPAQPPPPEHAWSPPPAPLPGLAVAPYPPQPWGPPMTPPVPVVPTVVSVAPRTHWLAAGALVGVGAAGLLAAGLLWMTRAPAPDPTAVLAASAPTGSVASVAPPSTAAPTVETKGAPVPEPVAPVVSPEPKSPAVAAATPPSVPNLEGLGAAVGGRSLAETRSLEPAPTRVEAEAVTPRPVVPVKRAAAVVETSKRAEMEDPFLSGTEEEMPVVEVPPRARAPVQVAKAAPKRDTSKPEVYSEFDEDYARELGFTDDSVPKEPERKGVKSVWVPPEPGAELPESLTPGDIQQVVVAHQPAIASCVRRYKEATGVSSGAFKVQWTVLPDGSTTRVQMLTVELRGTALSRCMEGLVRGWKFPKHRTQQKPIEFPFRF